MKTIPTDSGPNPDLQPPRAAPASRPEAPDAAAAVSGCSTRPGSGTCRRVCGRLGFPRRRKGGKAEMWPFATRRSRFLGDAAARHPSRLDPADFARNDAVIKLWLPRQAAGRDRRALRRARRQPAGRAAPDPVRARPRAYRACPPAPARGGCRASRSRQRTRGLPLVRSPRCVSGGGRR